MSTEVQSLLINSSTFLFKFTVNQMTDDYVSILSVFNAKLLVSCYEKHKLFIYSSLGHYLSTIITSKLCDASWTPQGNIIYTSSGNYNIMVISEVGKIIKRSNMAEPLGLSVSSDGIIYLADSTTGIHQSVDDGISWKFVMKPNSVFGCKLVLKVTTENSDDIWILEDKGLGLEHQLNKYSIGREFSEENLTWMEIAPKEKVAFSIFNGLCKLSNDNKGNIFLSDDDKSNSVHVFSENGQYIQKLLTLNDIYANKLNEPKQLSMDNKNKLLYFGTRSGEVIVFKIFYEAKTMVY